jgi:TonB-dependent receptor
MKRQFKKTTLSIAVAQAAMIWGGAAFAQATPAPEGSAAGADKEVTTIIVSGQRAAMQSAAKLKQDAEEIIDGVVAEEAGKLPDKSITEVLQRVVGVTMDRNRSRADPEHFSVEGSGISVRGLTWGSSTLNGRESFSAGWPGRELSWGDVPSELMQAVIVHKNPPAELIEGGVSGQVDLRTALPFDYKGDKFAFSSYANYNQLGSKSSPAVSGLVSKRWENSLGQWGALLDLSANETNTHNDTVQVDAYFPRTDIVAGKTVWVPKSASWRTNTSKTDRAGVYGALQWKKNGVESALTYFHSGYKTYDNENALYTGVENSYKSQLVNPVFNANGVLQSAKYTYPFGGQGANNFAAGGLEFNSNSTFADNRSQTREIAWNTKWTVNERLSLQNDLQWVHAADSSFSGNQTLGTFVPSMNVDLTGTPARITFDDAAQKFLSNPANYFLQNMMPFKNKSDGDLYAWKLDARYKFDHPVLRDLRFGVRLTERKANHTDATGSTWYSAATPWEVRTTSVPGRLPTSTDQQTWQPRASFGYLGDPRYAALVPTTLFSYANFFNGKVPVPAALVVPTQAMVKDYPNSYASVAKILQYECEDGNQHFGTNNDCSTRGSDWQPFAYDGDPSKTSRQEEKTQAAYLSARFGWDDLRFPVEGSAGVRVVHTETVAHGYTVFKPTYGTGTPPDVPQFGTIDEPINARHSYVNVLPSLNLKTDLSDKLQARFAFAQSMYRPGFGDLNEYIELHQNVTNGSGSSVQNISYLGYDKGNVNLNPTRANSYDLSLEWYPGNGTSLTADVFYKKVRDIILNSAIAHSYKDLAGNAQNFLIQQKSNEADGSVAGLEVAGQTYFNNVSGLQGLLPEWAKGFGIQANYTYIDSKQTLHHPFDMKYCPSSSAFNNSSLNLYGCDTNGLPFSSLPLMYLSRNAYNLTLMYDKGPLSARLAYSWRSRFLQGVQVNGTQGSDATSADPARATVGADGKTVYPQDVGWGLPTWQEATGQLDLGVDYRFDEHLSASFSASNLTDMVVRQTQQQTIGTMSRAWFEPGRSYRLAIRYTF